MIGKRIVGLMALLMPLCVQADDFIRIGTEKMDLVLKVNGQKRLVQSYFGKKLVYDLHFNTLNGISKT